MHRWVNYGEPDTLQVEDETLTSLGEPFRRYLINPWTCRSVLWVQRSALVLPTS